MTLYGNTIFWDDEGCIKSPWYLRLNQGGVWKSPEMYPGARTELRIPIVSIIGTQNWKYYKLVQSIHSAQKEVFTFIPIVGKPYNADSQINSIVGGPYREIHVLTDEIISEETLVEVEKRLNEIMGKVDSLNLSELEDKIKVLAKTIKTRYDGYKDNPAPQNMG